MLVFFTRSVIFLGLIFCLFCFVLFLYSSIESLIFFLSFEIHSFFFFQFVWFLNFIAIWDFDADDVTNDDDNNRPALPVIRQCFKKILKFLKNFSISMLLLFTRIMSIHKHRLLYNINPFVYFFFISLLPSLHLVVLVDVVYREKKFAIMFV